ncbi:MAG: 4Fe-4S dicluster domain-containing protein [Anaerolineae bacterium]|nr:4Fe-4S dicluster domain-containing protein [Anaerolineae bacterium]
MKLARPERELEPSPPASLDAQANGISRRALLKIGAGGILLVGVAGKWLPFAQALEEVKADYAMIIDLNKCTGCGACEQACGRRNNLAEGKSFIRRLRKEEQEQEDCWCLPVQCQHCQDAPCARVCPASATYRHPSGVVLVNEKACVGCKYCAVACPYDARTYDEHTGVVNKCWLCLDWVLGGGQPACAQACVTGARIFGRRDDPEIAELLSSGRAQALHPEFGTRPAVVSYIFRGT